MKKLILLLAAGLFTVNCGKKMSAQNIDADQQAQSSQYAPVLNADVGTTNTTTANTTPQPDLNQILNVIGSIQNNNNSVGLGNMLGGLFGGGNGTTAGLTNIIGNLFGGSGSAGSNGTCSTISSLLGIGSQIIMGGNPLVGAAVPTIANLLLGCGGSASGLAGLLPTGHSGVTQVIGQLANLMLQNNAGANPFSALLNIQNINDVSGMINILTGLVGQSGTPELASLLQTVQTYAGFLNHGTVNPACGSMNPVACQVFGFINQIRKQNDLSILPFNPICAQAAQSHSQDLSLNSLLSHFGSDGSTPEDRVAELGLVGNVVENIVKGKKLSAAEAVQMLLASPKNAQHIMDPNLKSLGIGFFDGIFTQCGVK